VKGDEAKLRADVDDGYTQVANLLLEAMALLPLSGAQLRIMLCLIRQSYGYSDGRKRSRRCTEWTATHAEWARRTGLARQTVCVEITELRKAKVVKIRPRRKRSRPLTVSINTNVAEWAHRDRKDRARYRAGLRELQGAVKVSADGDKASAKVSATGDKRWRKNARTMRIIEPLKRAVLQRVVRESRGDAAREILESVTANDKAAVGKKQVGRLAEVLRKEQPSEAILEAAVEQTRDVYAGAGKGKWFVYLCRTIKGMCADECDRRAMEHYEVKLV